LLVVEEGSGVVAFRMSNAISIAELIACVLAPYALLPCPFTFVQGIIMPFVLLASQAAL
jgi:hypothetical protein